MEGVTLRCLLEGVPLILAEAEEAEGGRRHQEGRRADSHLSGRLHHLPGCRCLHSAFPVYQVFPVRVVAAVEGAVQTRTSPDAGQGPSEATGNDRPRRYIGRYVGQAQHHVVSL